MVETGKRGGETVAEEEDKFPTLWFELLSKLLRVGTASRAISADSAVNFEVIRATEDTARTWREGGGGGGD